MDATMDTTDAMKRWELENEVEWHQDGEDELYRYDAAEQAAILEKKPWTTDPQYYKHVRVSALALLKMAMHCRSGGDIEVMGLMQGKVAGDTFIVIDTFALPVEGQIKDLSDKLEQVDGNFGRSSRFGAGLGADQKKDDKPLGKVLHDSKNVAGEHISGQITQLIKHLLFNHDPRRCKGH
eukprot:jgi/Pico_ML_1/51380/g2427.t2